ncbi:MAG: carbonic anhydrase [Gallionella sp.]|nr:carbonic anhydrase [Gallionella sp.]
MFSKLSIVLLAVALSTPPGAGASEQHQRGDDAVAIAFIKEIQSGHSAYTAAKSATFFKELSKGQKPRAAIVTCSDSRVHSKMWDKTPEGDLFMIRNIGNQLSTSLGSVQYGVNHLNASLLLIVGHSRCGAITAASGDYSALEEPIRKELDTIRITKGNVNIDGVKTNVNNQVAAALGEWGDRVKAGELLVVGAVYDFANDMKKGAGKLNIININGETDPAKLRSLPKPTVKPATKPDNPPPD